MEWLEEWWSASLGDEGFWRTQEPVDHFRTSTHPTDPASVGIFVDILLRLAGGNGEYRSGPGLQGMVEVGAANGAVLGEVAARRPQWLLHGVDVRPPGSHLPEAVRWTRAAWDVNRSAWTDARGRTTDAPWTGRLPGPVLVLAHEWLDDLPCRIATRTPRGWQLLGPQGPTGRTPDAAETAWLADWAGDADVVEIGLTRERAWAAVAATLPAGSILVAVDYGHLRGTRPPQGALLGYRHGRAVPPVPDGRTNITAPVAIDALAVALERLPGVRRRLLARQAELVAPPEGAEPASALQRLVRANRRRTLHDPDRLGANWWLVHEVGATA